MIDVARWYLGDVVRASASLRTFVQRADIDGGVMDNANDSACLLLDFASGAHAVIHIGLPNIVGPGLAHTGQTVIISGHDGTLETRCDPWTGPGAAVSEIVGLRRGAEHAETLTIPTTTSAAPLAMTRSLCFDDSRSVPACSLTRSSAIWTSAPASLTVTRCSASSRRPCNPN